MAGVGLVGSRVIATQIGIAICGVTAFWLSQDRRISWRRWSPIFGLGSQPFWIAETLDAHQWGILALTLVYTLSWMRGLRSYWFSGATA